MVNRNQIINGLRYFIRNDMLGTMPDGITKIMVGTEVDLILSRADNIFGLIDNMDNTTIKNVLQMFMNENGDIDIQGILGALKNNIGDMGMDISIPYIDITNFKKNSITFTIDRMDIDKLYDRIMNK